MVCLSRFGLCVFPQILFSPLRQFLRIDEVHSLSLWLADLANCGLCTVALALFFGDFGFFASLSRWDLARSCRKSHEGFVRRPLARALQHPSLFFCPRQASNWRSSPFFFFFCEGEMWLGSVVIHRGGCGMPWLVPGPFLRCFGVRGSLLSGLFLGSMNQASANTKGSPF